MKRFVFPSVLSLLLGAGLAFATAEREAPTAEPAAEVVSAAKYREAPMLAALVAAGELAPVEERLPEEPLVRVPPEIGRYGGTARTFTDASWIHEIFGWNCCGYVLDLEVGGKIVPSIAKGYEFADDATSLTIFLREGMKWSDGEPFTADDLLFRFYDVGMDERVPEGYRPEPIQDIIKLDEHTLRFDMERPFPSILTNMANHLGTDYDRVAPKHYLKKWHLTYNPKADEVAKEEGYNNWVEAFTFHLWQEQDKDAPTLRPWMHKQSGANVFHYVRNPYWYAVDPAGNQLPYIDEIVSTVVSSEVYQLKAISGEADIAFISTTLENYPLYKENEQQGGYRTLLIPGSLGAEGAYSINQNQADPVLREIFQEVRFRRALSLAIDRNEMNETLFFGLGVPRQATVNAGVSYYKPEWGERHPYARYDPDAANRLLDEMGLSARDGNGFRLRPDGKTLSVVLEFSEGYGLSTAGHELVREYWENVGVEVILKVESTELFWERILQPVYEIQSGPMGGSEDAVDRKGAYALWYADTTWAPLWIDWLIADRDIRLGRKTLADFEGGQMPGEQPPDDILELWPSILRKAYETTFGSDQYRELNQMVFDFLADKLYVIGTVGMVPFPYIAKNTIGNVPTEAGEAVVPNADSRWWMQQTSWQLFFKEGS